VLCVQVSPWVNLLDACAVPPYYAHGETPRFDHMIEWHPMATVHDVGVLYLHYPHTFDLLRICPGVHGHPVCGPCGDPPTQTLQRSGLPCERLKNPGSPFSDYSRFRDPAILYSRFPWAGLHILGSVILCTVLMNTLSVLDDYHAY
jgi:hypothetical protein